ncbi:hypothetical protein JAAARDRAFT_28650 [Jaapia argillacea MUCL 33604]|uniref:Nucleolar protein 9 n=1 Tax=Jaapia argillacea MUCL 33604 TaxID=933084 RepID=A0A067QFQ2_9AGAM|nr:hypothetical protein JAAARDRAFT_28650 [Jaapia argillacea MUCL 33604]
MPRENRKRGKKHKKPVEEPIYSKREPEAVVAPEQTQHSGPSWIVSAPKPEGEEFNPEAPFGYVDADVKAYFRTVDLQIREWQESAPGAEYAREGEAEDGDGDPNEERRMFFVAALTEMSGKERQLATDPDCSSILERMAYSMDDFVRRVFVDSLVGSYEQLVKHRFASHVCQTLFTVAADTVSRETRGIVPPVTDSPDKGELHTLTELVLDICDELLPSLSTLVANPFASHVLRALLLLLSPSSSITPTSSAVRSKKSAAWKTKQGPMKSLFVPDGEKESNQNQRKVNTPKEFAEAAGKIVMTINNELGENEVRALGADKVASPVLQILLEIESKMGWSDKPGSLMDKVLVGMVTSYHASPTTPPQPSDYLLTLLRDPTASHLLETLLTHSPQPIFNLIFSAYFINAPSYDIKRLAVHPVANFVVAKAVGRAGAEDLGEVCRILEEVGGKVVKTGRIGVFKAMVERAETLGAKGKEVNELISSAFGLETDEDRKILVPCALRLKPLSEYQALLAAQGDEREGDEVHKQQDSMKKRGRRGVVPDEAPMEPKVQGALLLQSMLRLPDPHYQLVLSSIQSLSIEALLSICHHPISSRILDALLDSPTIPSIAKRKFIMSFIGHFHVLADDRIGSRVAERCWAGADPYVKEKIGKSLIAHDQFLAASYYGKYFARKLNLSLLQRRPEEWKALQSANNDRGTVNVAQRPGTKPVNSTLVTHERKEETSVLQVPSQGKAKSKGKRKHDGDEIDELFEAKLGKKVKRSALEGAAGKDLEEAHTNKGMEMDKGLSDVLGAIRSAPAGEKAKKKRTK